ncbi:hypothetical protein KY317_04370 [Candidatus Woesearchaeota archaeon]|nr:hypothetical protein [Candidatus Woesearchaeota archaeon]
MSLFGLFGKKKKDEFAPPEMGLGRESDIGLKFPEEEHIGVGLAPQAGPAGEMIEPAGMQPAGVQPSGMRPMMQQQFPQQMASPVSISKDFELLSAKLDALKALLENINQRLQNLERIAQGEHHEAYY